MPPGSQPYKFLEAISESEAASLGVNLADKIRHYLYRAIRERSTVKEARKKDLFTLDTRIEELTDLHGEEIRAVLQQLIEDRVVTQIFRFDYKVGEQSIELESCFVACASDQNNYIPAIYQDLILQSVESVEALLESLPSVTEEQILEELEFDLRKNVAPRPNELKYTVVDLATPADPVRFEILPTLELINTTLHLIRKELEERKRIVFLEYAGLLPLRESEILLRFRIAAEFMMTKVASRYGGDELRTEFNRIDLEEADYFSDIFASPTARFMVKRAGVLRRGALGQDPSRRDSWFPGSLAVSIVLSLEDEANRKYGELWDADLERRVREFKERIVRSDAGWFERLRVVDPVEMASLPPRVKERLQEENELYHTIWETPGGTVHLFIPARIDLLEKLLLKLAESPPEEKWKIFAIQNILDRYEGRIPELRTSTALEQARLRLINAGSLAYLPWYLRPLLLIFPSLFAHRAMRMAGERVRSEQEVLKDKNRKLEQEKRAGEEKERALQRERLRTNALGRIISRKLDEFYIESGRIPLVRDVQDALREMDSALFFDAIRKRNFQLVPLDRGDPITERILLYPLNNEWRGKNLYLFRSLEKLFLEDAKGGEGGSEQLNRARALQKYLEKIDSVPIPETKSDDMDPYRRFEEAIKKYK